MSPALLDTDVLSLYLRKGDIAIVDHCRRYIQRHGRLTLSILTYYEVLSGLRYRDARKQLDGFQRFGIALAAVQEQGEVEAGRCPFAGLQHLNRQSHGDLVVNERIAFIGANDLWITR